MPIGYRNPQSDYFLQGNALDCTALEKNFEAAIIKGFKFSKQSILNIKDLMLHKDKIQSQKEGNYLVFVQFLGVVVF